MTRQIFQISIPGISMFPLQITEIITSDNLATDIRLTVQHRNHYRIGRGCFINNSHNSVSIHHSHFRADAGRRALIERNVIIRLIQTVLYDTCFEQLIICLRYLLDTVYSDRIYLMLPQRLFQISDLLFECHVTVQQVFVDRLKMKIRAYSSRNFINCPYNHIGRSEKSTLLVAVEPK